jgi:hypothetical protein
MSDSGAFPYAIKGSRMKKLLIMIPLCSAANPAFAHLGHFGEFAGHDHLAAGIAIGIAAGIAVIGALKGAKRDDDENLASEEADEQPQEA